ncbi:phosphoribosylglycinamide formyltransferase [Cohnella zeiphila]|uniref:Phosphoribosylglycinamide formyltransferase n=1 Tax=Cohnella zeiphila TaxID=2761120 RepID=A0A7X0SJW5_9BACL|nr:phosphoribosylglycinamide formyltransferase [Cohnella zeiphila]MBB6731216.1 phosphoribosylglycinamide formyltransferase [Cohnella zeiphila]
MASSRLKIAVFASGGGSNFQALAEAVRATNIPAELALLVCDKPAARVVQRAESLGVPTFLFKPKDYPSREAYEQEIVRRLNDEGIELIVLAGYMRLITDVIVKPYYGRMINIHPALLPAFPGVGAVRQALEYGVKLTGVTVHFVDGGMDTGPIVAQRAVEVREGDTEETLAERIHAAEHELLPLAVRWIAEGRVTLTDRKVNVRPGE